MCQRVIFSNLAIPVLRPNLAINSNSLLVNVLFYCIQVRCYSRLRRKINIFLLSKLWLCSIYWVNRPAMQANTIIYLPSKFKRKEGKKLECWMKPYLDIFVSYQAWQISCQTTTSNPSFTKYRTNYFQFEIKRLGIENFHFCTVKRNMFSINILQSYTFKLNHTQRTLQKNLEFGWWKICSFYKLLQFHLLFCGINTINLIRETTT